MSPEFHLEVHGLDENQRKLRALALTLLDLRPFWPKVVPLFVGWMRRQFETEGAWAGHPWAPLSTRYQQRKLLEHPGRGILYAEGDLRMAASLPERFVTPESMTLTIDWAAQKGDDVRYEWHHRGTEHMPARPLLFDALPPDARLELDQVAEEYADEMLRRVGL